MQALLSDIENRSNELNQVMIEMINDYAQVPERFRTWTSSSGLSIDDIMSRSSAIQSAATVIGKTPKDRFFLLPLSRLINIRDLLITLADHVNGLSSTLKTLRSWGGIASSDPSVAITSNGNSTNIRSLLDNIVNYQDSFLEHNIVVSAVIRPKGMGTYASASRVLQEKALSASKIVTELDERIKLNEALTAEVQDRLALTSGAAAEASRILQDIELRRKSVDENEQRISAAAASIDEVRSKAETLSAQVSSFLPQFEAFDGQIKNREKEHKSSIAKLSDATEYMTKVRNELDLIVEKSRDVLGGATVAGLSSEYAIQAKAIDRQLNWSRYSYYLSIFLLIISVMFALGILPRWLATPLPTIPRWENNIPATAYVVQVLSSLGTRLMVILPAGLLAAFSSSRYASLFRLREEYNHKKGLAASVDGFKAQAPAYAEPIAAAVFQELLRNPATAIDGKADISPNGYLANLLEPKVREAIASLLQARDGATKQG